MDDFTISLFTESVLYGIYTSLFCVTLYILLTRRKSMSHIVLTVLTVVMFGIVTSHVVLSLRIGPTPPSRFCPSISCVLAEYLPCLNFVLGDLIVIWRAWVLWGRNKHVFVLPLFLIIATVADVSTVLVLSIRAVLLGADLAADSGAGLALIIMHTLCIALTLCTNALVTLLVGYRTWYFTSNCGGSRWHIGPDRCLPVLLLLIESGALYCIVWVTYIVVDVLYGDWAPSRSLVFQIFQNAVPQITGIYPTLIIILCSLKRTFHDIVSPRPSPGSSYNNLDLENLNSGSSKARRLPNQEAGFNDTSLTLSTPFAPQTPSSIPLRAMRPYDGGTPRSPPPTFGFERRPSESSPAASEYILTGLDIETASNFALALQDAIKATNEDEGASRT